jgi:hypothetical protein
MLVLEKAFNGLKVEKMQIVMRMTVEYIVDTLRRRFRGTKELFSCGLDERNMLLNLIARLRYCICLVRI